MKPKAARRVQKRQSSWKKRILAMEFGGLYKYIYIYMYIGLGVEHLALLFKVVDAEIC